MNSSQLPPRSQPVGQPGRKAVSPTPGRCLVLATACLMTTIGCRGGGLLNSGDGWWPNSWNWSSRSQSPGDSAGSKDSDSDRNPSTVGDYVSISGLGMITLEGVGLVTGLDGTGGDPKPSPFRMALLKDIQRRDVPNPKALLRSPSTALVIVRAYLPPLIRKGESFDVEVRLPPGSEATSLNGGWLMEADVSERALVPGEGVLSGHVFARAKGHVLISHGEGDIGELAGVVRRGRVPGGGISRRDRDLTMALKNRYRSVRMAKRIANRIGTRFYAYNRHGVREPLANPKTDRTIMLKVHPKYRDNFPRYLQVIRKIAMREDDVERQVRMQQLTGQLQKVESARETSLALEAIGPKAIPFLKPALDHADFEVRFHAATALAYLDDNSGANVLAEAARHERAFRVYALAALSTLEDAPSQLLLRKLLKPLVICDTDGCSHQGSPITGPCPRCQSAGELKQSAELQYGAFRALWTRDRLDPTIRGEQVRDLFTMHEVQSNGRPLIHLTQLQRPEIVLFGTDQQFRTPLAIQAGNHIWINAQSGSPKVTISRYQVGRPPVRRTVSTRVADVIRTTVELGASYPDIIQMLVQAQRQQNVAGQIAIDSVPRTGRVFFRGGGPKTGTRTTLGSANSTPNLFSTVQSSTPGSADNSDTDEDREEVNQAGTDPEPGNQEKETQEKADGSASLADRRATDQVSEPETRSQDDSGSRFPFLEKLFR